MNIPKLIILFFVSVNSFSFSQNPNFLLMESIRKGDRVGVQKTLELGADINYVDIKTQDTPIFYSTKCALETILGFGIWNYDTYVTVLSSFIFCATMCFIAGLDEYSSKFRIFIQKLQTSKHFWLKYVSGGILILNGLMYVFMPIYLSNRFKTKLEKSIPDRIDIVCDLLKRNDLNRAYKHTVYKIDIAEFFKVIQSGQEVGRFHHYPSGHNWPALGIKLAGKNEYVFGECGFKEIMSNFEKIFSMSNKIDLKIT